MKENNFAAIDAQDSLSALIKESFDVSIDNDSGFVSMRETDQNDDLTFN